MREALSQHQQKALELMRSVLGDDYLTLAVTDYELRERFDDQHLFLDVDDQAAGEDYRVAIEKALDQAAVVLVVIGPRWVSMSNAAGRRRIDDPGDMVRAEIESALRHGTRIVPVLVEGAVMPRPTELPEPLRPLSYRNAVVVRPDPDFASDMERLVASYACEWKKAIEDPEILKRFRHFVNSNGPDDNVVFVTERGQIRPARPSERARKAQEAAA